MWSEHPKSWILLLSAGTLAGLFVGSTLQAQDGERGPGAGAIPLTGRDVPAIQEALRTDRAVDSVGSRVRSAIAGAVGTATCYLQTSGVEPAREAMRKSNPSRALVLVRAFRRHAGEDTCPSGSSRDSPSFASLSEERRRAWLLEANALLELDRPNDALRAARRVDPRETPISDYAHWLRAKALRGIDNHERAAELFGRVYDDEETPLRYRARARQAMALVDAGRGREALPILDRMLELFPTYPRRFQLLFDRARSLEMVGRFYEAAEAYQTAWYEYPHKSTGSRALARMEILEARGYGTPRLSRRELFDRYRQLRINKHWDLAEQLFTRLLNRVETPSGHSGFEHEIRMQLALNAYVPKRNAEALRHLRHLQKAWTSGHRDSISIDLVEKYLTRTLSRLGHYEEALATLRRRLGRKSAYTKKTELLEFFRKHGRYEKAYKLANSFYSRYKQRRWPFTWLLYKTGRFEEALEHFEFLAKHRSGRHEAKALYWRARTLARMEEPERAKGVYEEIAREYSTSYYGIQAVNRLVDLERRSAVDGVFADHTASVIDSGEEVFTTFENVAERADRANRAPTADPTMVPRHVDGEGTPSGAPQVTAASCQAGTEAERSFCRLMAGDIPEQTLNVIRQAVSPLQPLATFGSEEETRTVSTRSTETVRAGRPPQPDESSRIADELANSPDEEPADQPNRVQYNRQGRIHWNGRDDSDLAFERFTNGHVIGPVPDPVRAYGNDEHRGGAERAAARAGELFPELVRARWLRDIGLIGEARRAARDAALEFRSIDKRYRPPDGRPHELPHRRWTYLIDYRRYGKGYWGYTGEPVKRYPVPDSWRERRELAERQQEIWDRREELEPLFVDALKEVGDYHLVRKFTLERGGWYNRTPSGSTRHLWMQAYPRAFPHKVVAESRQHGINPYLIWSLMTVESSYNPDSISAADAIGLLQVIPRTGIKVADWMGDDDFGPYDLIDEETAIEHGVYYFSSLVQKFRGQELLAAAGYNGGPHRVAAWMEKRGGMPHDEFVEEIPFDQARLYVKKVTRFLGLYMRIYEDRKRLYIGQNVNEDYRPNPNF